jgi:hypothetical protein
MFRKILGKDKYFFGLHPTPKGPCGGFWSPPDEYFSNYDPIGP